MKMIAPSPQIISISRRTDIPAYYSSWLKRRFYERWVEYSNPFSGKAFGISLEPDDVSGIVFWSRNYAPIFDLVEELKDRRYPMIFHLTKTAYSKPFETGKFSLENAVEQFKHLAQIFSPEHLIWRYDPIIISSVTDENWHLERFSRMVSELKQYTRRCYFSFIQIYKKVGSNFSKVLPGMNIEFSDPTPGEKLELTHKLQDIASDSGIDLFACCQPELVEKGIAKASCVDKNQFQELYPERIFQSRHKPLRKGCGCYDSRDIGAYDSCPNGCLYCYATSSSDKARRFIAGFDPEKTILK